MADDWRAMSKLDDDLTEWSRGGWLPWEMYPPQRGSYEVVEYIRRDRADWRRQEPQTARLEDLLHPRNAAWNIAGLYWRPVL